MRGEHVMIMVAVLIFMGLIGLGILIFMQEEKIDKARTNFCKVHGYMEFDEGKFRWSQHYCIKWDGDILYKREIVECGKTYCFVEGGRL